MKIVPILPESVRRLSRESLFQFRERLGADGLGVQTPEYDTVLGVRNLPSHEDLVGIVRTDDIAVIGRVFLFAGYLDLINNQPTILK